MRIVIIDNDQAFVRSLAILLRAYGHEVRAFCDPVNAGTWFEDRPAVDVLLLDYLMPGCHGARLLDLIRPHLPAGTRVFLVSGHSELFDRRDLPAMGIDGFFPKPLDLDRLVALVGRPAANDGNLRI